MNRVSEQGDSINIAAQKVCKIEVAANRYDLLCVEGIATAFRTYLNLGKAPVCEIKNSVPVENLMQVHVKPETAAVRPCVVACILRDIEFDIPTYNSFIDLQDKLHQNICRRRTLASMGTHDLDHIVGPITYEALPPSEIIF